jgi:hypothetical protein
MRALLLTLLVVVPAVSQVFFPARKIVPVPMSGYTPPLDVLTNPPWAAYSVSRKLWSGWTGGAYVVQRMGDMVTNIIGFTSSGVTDTNALMAFLGTTNGYTWAIYDQSGNGRHLDSFGGGDSITNTFLVGSNGVVVVDENNRPAGWHRSTTSSAHISGPSAGTSSNTAFLVTTPLVLSGADPDGLANAGGRFQCAINLTSGSFFSVINDPAGTPVVGTPVNLGRQYLATGLFRTSNVEVLQVNFNASDTYSGEAGELTSASIGLGVNAVVTSAGQAFNELIWYSTQTDTNSWSLLSDNMVDYYEIDQGPPDPPDNPVILWYKFTEGSGSSIADSSGNGYNGTLNGATWVTGKSGSGFALQFDGTDDFAQTASVTYGTAIITVCAWVYWDAFANNDDLAWELTANFGGTSQTYIFIPNESSTTRAYMSMHKVAGFRSESFTRWTAATWTHIAIVYNNTAGASDITVYVNGTATATTLDLNNEPAAGGNFATAVLNLFARNGASLFGAGRLDDLRIYSGALTAAEVAMVMLDPQ